MKLIVFATLFIAAFAAEKPYLGFNLPSFSTRIIGGSDANRGEFPYLVSLQWDAVESKIKHFCGGAILNDRWILTSERCVLAIPTIENLIVKAGKHDIAATESGEQERTVAKIVLYETYPGAVNPYNIAMLKLSTRLNFNDAVAPINLPKLGVTPTGNGVLIGWGSISNSSVPDMPNILQKANVPIIDLESCRQAFHKLVGTTLIGTENICTGPLTGEISACNGDSGGPLVAKNSNGTDELIGIVSWNVVPCGTRGAPSIYTKVSSFIYWYNNVINNN